MWELTDLKKKKTELKCFLKCLLCLYYSQNLSVLLVWIPIKAKSALFKLSFKEKLMGWQLVDLGAELEKAISLSSRGTSCPGPLLTGWDSHRCPGLPSWGLAAPSQSLPASLSLSRSLNLLGKIVSNKLTAQNRSEFALPCFRRFSRSFLFYTKIEFSLHRQ